MSPSFHKLGEPENYTDIDLSYVEKVDNSTFDKKPIEEFLSDIDKKLAEKVEIEQQIEKLKAQLAAANASVAMLDCALALQYKVKRL